MGIWCFWFATTCFTYAAAEPPDSSPRVNKILPGGPGGGGGGGGVSGDCVRRETAAHAGPTGSASAVLQSAIQDLVSQGTGNDEFRTVMVTTFTELESTPQIKGDLVYVIVYPDTEQIAVWPMGTSLATSIENLADAAGRLDVTAIILVTKAPPQRAIDEGFSSDGFWIRWYSNTGTEYNICGHGNAAAGVALAEGQDTYKDTLHTVYEPTRALGIDLTFKRATTYESQQVREVGVVQTIGSLHHFASTPVLTGGNKVKVEEMLGGVPVLKFYEAVQLGVIIEVKTFDELKQIHSTTLKERSCDYDIANAGYFVEKRPPLKDVYNDNCTRQQKVDGFIVFMVESAGSETAPAKIRYRAFYPDLYVDEDKVTGSAFALITAAIHKHGAQDIEVLRTKFEGQQVSTSEAGQPKETGGIAAGAVESEVFEDTNKAQDDELRTVIKISGQCAELQDSSLQIAKALQENAKVQGSALQVGDTNAAGSIGGTSGGGCALLDKNRIPKYFFSSSVPGEGGQMCDMTLETKSGTDTQKQEEFWKAFEAVVKGKAGALEKFTATYTAPWLVNEVLNAGQGTPARQQHQNRQQENLPAPAIMASLLERRGTEMQNASFGDAAAGEEEQAASIVERQEMNVQKASSGNAAAELPAAAKNATATAHNPAARAMQVWRTGHLMMERPKRKARGDGWWKKQKVEKQKEQPEPAKKRPKV